MKATITAAARLFLVVLHAAACAPPSQVAPVVSMTVVPVASAPDPALPAMPTTPTKAPGADCTPASVIYVTLAPLTNETGRPAAEIEGKVMGALSAKVAHHDGIVLTHGEHVAGRCEVMLVPTARAFIYEGGNLRVRFGLRVQWRSDGSLIGSADKTLTKESVAPNDRASELQVLELAAGVAAEKFVEGAHAFVDPTVD